MVGLGRYTVLSVAAAMSAVVHAWYTRQQLYPALVHLTSSKIAIVVLGNFALSVMLCFGRLVKATFLGKLRESEVERLHDRVKESMMEMCIAMTIFREEFSFPFVSYFSILLFIKVFHWLATDRIEFLETTPTVTRLRHFRCIALVGVLLLVDMLLLREAAVEMVTNGPSVVLLFAFEYLILATTCIQIATKYVLYRIDRWYEGNWSAKGICVFYLELVTQLFQLVVYSLFFSVILMYYGLPFHLLRDLYWSVRNFKNRLVAFIKYRRITLNMNENFDDATADDIGDDPVCIICREDMVAGAAKKLPCGHVFHSACLRSWLERQQTCPMCRTSVMASGQTEDQRQPQPQQQQEQRQQNEREGEQRNNDAPNNERPGERRENNESPAENTNVTPNPVEARQAEQRGSREFSAERGGAVQPDPSGSNGGTPDLHRGNFQANWQAHVSMAAFNSAPHMQFAGQQSPNVIPNIVSPVIVPFATPFPVAQEGTPEQQAAAAMATANAAAFFNPGMMLMPTPIMNANTGNEAARAAAIRAATIAAMLGTGAEGQQEMLQQQLEVLKASIESMKTQQQQQAQQRGSGGGDGDDDPAAQMGPSASASASAPSEGPSERSGRAGQDQNSSRSTTSGVNELRQRRINRFNDTNM